MFLTYFHVGFMLIVDQVMFRKGQGKGYKLGTAGLEPPAGTVKSYTTREIT